MTVSELIAICGIGITLIIAILYYIYKLGGIGNSIKNVEKKVEKLEESKDSIIQRFAQLEGRFLIIEQLTLRNIEVKQGG